MANSYYYEGQLTPTLQKPRPSLVVSDHFFVLVDIFAIGVACGKDDARVMCRIALKAAVQSGFCGDIWELYEDFYNAMITKVFVILDNRDKAESMIEATASYMLKRDESAEAIERAAFCENEQAGAPLTDAEIIKILRTCSLRHVNETAGAGK